jgi:hypothetical protein
MTEKETPTSAELMATVKEPLASEARLIAAIAYGEASTDDNVEEVCGIAHAVINRSAAWGISVAEMLKKDKNYTYAANGGNARFNLLNGASVEKINDSAAMRVAVNAAIRAASGEGGDPSNGAYWWDGLDLKDLVKTNPRVAHGFKFASDDRNIFKMDPIIKNVIVHWRVRDKKTLLEVDSVERGRYDTVYVSTAAKGKTVFWKYNPDFVRASGAKEYK